MVCGYQGSPDSLPDRATLEDSDPRAWRQARESVRDKTVCIIDDELSVRQSLESLVRSMGGQARAYKSAELFLAHGREAPFDCVVCDIQMSGMTGVELLARLRADACEVPFILVTGHLTVRSREEAGVYRALCVLEKPFDPEELAQWINKALAAM